MIGQLAVSIQPRHRLGKCNIDGHPEQSPPSRLLVDFRDGSVSTIGAGTALTY